MEIIKKAIKKLILRILSLFGQNVYAEFLHIYMNYYISFGEDRPRSLQIYCLDGKTSTCGFADRLRGIVTIYAYAKARNLPFKIQHEVPFLIEEFFEPNEVDWKLQEGEKIYNVLYANPIFILDYTKGKRLKYLSRNRQHHFYTNVNALPVINKKYGTSFDYKGLFRELFKPSHKLELMMRPYEKYIEEGYISVSFRFMQLMGDFKDVRGRTLIESEQIELANKCINFIERIHINNSNIKWVLITTDSSKFLKCVQSIEYVFVINGEIGHIGYKSNYAVINKTMLDFYMISKAKKVYMGYTGEMYKSHFAESAAEISGVPYESICF